MIWFDFEYKTSTEIVNTSKTIVEYSPLEYFILFLLVTFFIVLLYYIIPAMNIVYTEKKKEKNKQKRKMMINQIAIQKDINDEIEKELNI